MYLYDDAKQLVSDLCLERNLTEVSCALQEQKLDQNIVLSGIDVNTANHICGTQLRWDCGEECKITVIFKAVSHKYRPLFTLTLRDLGR